MNETLSSIRCKHSYVNGSRIKLDTPFGVAPNPYQTTMEIIWKCKHCGDSVEPWFHGNPVFHKGNQIIPLERRK